MVEVGDNVIVAPLDGQKDKMAVITGPAGAGAVLNEGDYNTWTLEWTKNFTDGSYDYDDLDVLIAENKNTLMMSWRDASGKYRFGVYNLADFSALFESPAGSNYNAYYAQTTVKESFFRNMVEFTYGGMSTSIQSYLLMTHSDEHTIEVWRGGASALWTRDTRADSGFATSYCFVGQISLTGKYILLVMYPGAAPWTNQLMLYKGSSV